MRGVEGLLNFHDKSKPKEQIDRKEICQHSDIALSGLHRMQRIKVG